MSLSISYKDLSNPAFIAGMRKIANHSGFKEPKVRYNIARLTSLLEQEIKIFLKLGKEIRDRRKAYKPENERAPTEADLAKLDEFREEEVKFAEVSFVIERHKVDFDDLSTIDITPAEIAALEPILTNLPE